MSIMGQFYKKYIYWLCVTIVVMFVLPFAVARLASECCLAGTWLFFDIKEVWFLIYAATYLALGWIAMLISKYLIKQHKIYGWTDIRGAMARTAIIKRQSIGLRKPPTRDIFVSVTLLLANSLCLSCYNIFVNTEQEIFTAQAEIPVHGFREKC